MFKSVRFAAIAAAATLIAAPAFAQSSPVVGTWATKIAVQDMTIESTMTVAQAAGGYTVEIKDGPMPGAPADAPAMPSTISDVKVEGSKLSFNRKLTTPQGEMALAYSGTVTGDAFAGEIASDFGPIPITGTRQ
jgi:uncharacterized protein (DUF111 family)